MTNDDGWGKAWSKTAEEILKHDSSVTPELKGLKDPEKIYSYDWPIPWLKYPQPSKTVIWLKGSQLKSQGSNLVDDQAYLYFQCESCQDILDPHTRSFKTLQDKRHEAGWKVVWNTNGLGYKVYCKKCGEGVGK